MIKIFFSTLLLLISTQAMGAQKLDIYKTCDLQDRLNRVDKLDLKSKKITVLNNNKTIYSGDLKQSIQLNDIQLEEIQKLLSEELNINLQIKSATMIAFGYVALLMIHTKENKDIVIDLATSVIVGYGPDCQTK